MNRNEDKKRLETVEDELLQARKREDENRSVYEEAIIDQESLQGKVSELTRQGSGTSLIV